MTVKLYITWEHQNNFSQVPILDDWSIKRDWNKVGSLTFKSPNKYFPGHHVKLTSTHHKTFGGQIVKRSEKSDNYYEYECLDYKRYLLGEVGGSFLKKRSSDIVKSLKRHVSQPIDWKVTNTKTIFPELMWRSTTVLDVINQLIWLEYTKGTLIYFDVDHNANLIYKPYPQTIKGYSLDSAYDYDNSLDYSDIATAYSLVSETGKVIEQYKNTDLEKIWGYIQVYDVFESGSGTTSVTAQSNSTGITDAEIKKVVAKVNKLYKGISWNSCDCWCMSERIFNKLKANKVPCKIIQYYSQYASSRTHRHVQVKYKSGWKDFDYSGFDSRLKTMKTRKQLKDPFVDKNGKKWLYKG